MWSFDNQKLVIQLWIFWVSEAERSGGSNITFASGIHTRVFITDQVVEETYEKSYRMFNDISLAIWKGIHPKSERGMNAVVGVSDSVKK